MYDYQKDAVVTILQEKMGGILTPYGSGKSWVVLEVCNKLLPHTNTALRVDSGVGVIILCKPRNVHTWIVELNKRWKKLRCYNLTGSATNQRTQLLTFRKTLKQVATQKLPLCRVVLIVPYSKLDAMIDAITTHVYPGYIGGLIGDESTVIKNPKTKVTKAALKLSTYCREGVRLILTGNIIPEGPHEIWSQFAFAGKYPFGDTYYNFLRNWFITTAFGRVLRHDKVDKFYNTLERFGYLLSQKHYDQLMSKLPYSHNTIEYYKMSSEQNKLTEQLYETWSLDDIEGKEMLYNYVLQIANKAQQICSGFYYDDQKRVVYTKRNPKIKLLLEVIRDLFAESKKRKVIVWRKFVPEDLLLQHTLNKYYRSWVIGSSEQSLHSFEHDKKCHIIVMPLGTTQGFNELAVADTNIFFSNDFSNEKREQAESRIKRLNNLSKHVTQIDLCSENQRDYEVILALQNKVLTKDTVTETYRYSKE